MSLNYTQRSTLACLISLISSAALFPRGGVEAGTESLSTTPVDLAIKCSGSIILLKFTRMQAMFLDLMQTLWVFLRCNVGTQSAHAVSYYNLSLFSY